MENNPSAQKQEKRYTKADLIAMMEASRANLEKTLSGLSEHQRTTPGPEKWAVKDHLVHLAVWELGIAELLQHRDRFAAMKVDEETVQTKSEDEINDIIYRQFAHLSWDEAFRKYEEAHRRLLEALVNLNDEDLYRPYAYFAGGKVTRQDPVLNWIAGNTFGHYDLHNQFIQSLLLSID